MPVYNGDTHLVEAVESVLSQSLENVELVAVDDGSEDGSRAILERFARADGRVTLIANDRRSGISAALNRGWRAAQAAYIARLDADDVALPNRLLHQADFLDAHPSVAVVGGAAVLIDHAGRPFSTLSYPTSSKVIRRTLLRHNCLIHPSVMLRRSALEDVGGYRFDYIEDYDLWLRFSENYNLVNLREPVILYRRHPAQLSLLALEEQARRRLAVRTVARTRRASGDDPLEGVQELTPEILARVNIDEAELASAFEHELLGWAATLAELGHLEQADELVARASRMLGRRTSNAFAAAADLRRAQALLSAHRVPAAVRHVLRSFRREPRYAFSHLREWLGNSLSKQEFRRWM